MRRRDVSVLGRDDLPVVVPEARVGRVETAGRDSAYEEVGERVAGVLNAAERAAEEILAEARREAEEILARARRTREEAEEYAADLRTSVEAYANQHGREAEAQARVFLEEAQAQARAIREAAEAIAHRLDGEAARRREAVRAETRGLEERRKRAHDDLRELIAQLEEILAAASAAESDRLPSLGDALSLRRRRS